MNTPLSSTTKTTPYKVVFGQHPRSSIALIEISQKMFVEILLYWNSFVIVLLSVIHWDVHVGRRTCSVPQNVLQMSYKQS